MSAALPNPSVLLGGLSPQECRGLNAPVGETHTILVAGRIVKYTDQLCSQTVESVHSHTNLNAVNRMLDTMSASTTLRDAKIHFQQLLRESSE